MSMTPYTTGNWTVSPLTKDTDSAAKNVSVPNLKYSSDYARTQDEPSQAIIANTTGESIESAESIRFAYSVVNDIYDNAGVDASARAPQKKGVQVMAELKTKYQAVNSVNGATIELPCTGRIVLRFPTYQAVTEDLVADLLMRTIASSFSDGETSVSRVLELARGSLLPDGI